MQTFYSEKPLNFAEFFQNYYLSLKKVIFSKMIVFSLFKSLITVIPLYFINPVEFIMKMRAHGIWDYLLNFIFNSPSTCLLWLITSILGLCVNVAFLYGIDNILKTGRTNVGNIIQNSLSKILPYTILTLILSTLLLLYLPLSFGLEGAAKYFYFFFSIIVSFLITVVFFFFANTHSDQKYVCY